MNDLLKKKPNEDYYRYIWRVGMYVRDGYFQNWQEIVDTVNEELYGDEIDSYKGESAFRKDFASAYRFYSSGLFDEMLGDKHITQLQEEQDRLYIVKRQVGDKLREYRKLLMLEGRTSNLEERLLNVVNNLNNECPLIDTPIIPYSSNKEAVLVLADWHFGMVTNNIWNVYNVEICKNRVKELIKKTIEYLEIFKINRLHIINCGDMVHGSIHISCRVTSEENTVEQLINVSELVAEVIEELSNYVNQVDYYSCYGNHARVIPNKEESVYSDNFERILPWWIEQRLQNNHKVKVYYSEYKEFTLLNVCGYNICAVHGDLDNIKKIAPIVNTLFTRKYNTTIDYVISADKHHLEEFESFDIESIIVRSLCGTDDYANERRLYSCAGQTLVIMSEEEGRECTRNIKLS